MLSGEARQRSCLGLVQIHLVPEQVTDVGNAVLDHGRALEAEPPGNHPHSGGQAHRRQHFWAEHAAVADFSPLAEVRVVAKNLRAN